MQKGNGLKNIGVNPITNLKRKEFLRNFKRLKS